MTSTPPAITDAQREMARLIWDYHQMDHDLCPADVAIGLGSHDLGVATTTADLYHQGLAKVVVFTGGNSPTTARVFPRGEAVHYAEHAIALGVPEHAILVEPKAANTGENIVFSRALLDQAGVHPATVLLVTKPYMQRRSYATVRKVWPEVEVVCASEQLAFEDYVASIGDGRLVVDMLVGDLQRVIEYPQRGFAVEQHVPEDVREAYGDLVAAGFTSRLAA
ncbi:YdcF family protein [Streptomyces sp. NPDC001889]